MCQLPLVKNQVSVAQPVKKYVTFGAVPACAEDAKTTPPRLPFVVMLPAPPSGLSPLRGLVYREQFAHCLIMGLAEVQVMLGTDPPEIPA